MPWFAPVTSATGACLLVAVMHTLLSVRYPSP